jgi:Holliday junction resolvase
MTYKRVDDNQAQVTKALRAEGWTVQHLHEVGKGCPDLIVGAKEKNFLVEVKDGKKAWKLTPDQVIWHYNWKGQIVVVTSPENAVETINNLLKSGK